MCKHSTWCTSVWLIAHGRKRAGISKNGQKGAENRQKQAAHLWIAPDGKHVWQGNRCARSPHGCKAMCSVPLHAKLSCVVQRLLQQRGKRRALLCTEGLPGWVICERMTRKKRGPAHLQGC